MIKQTSLEKMIEKFGFEVYPITFLKFLLNKGRILSYFRKALDPEFELRIIYDLNYDGCEQCQIKMKSDNVLCRQHTSIDRVLNANNVAHDIDTNTFFYKNEIFMSINETKMVIVYCPHPKLITGDITDKKARKVNPITVMDPNLSLPKYEKIIPFSSGDLLTKNVRCWFNNEFSIVTIPEDRNKSNWCLVPNH